MVMIGEKPWVKHIADSTTHGTFVVEPLQRGFGVTLGNSLRRVLLSSLQGAAIVAIKIEGAPHEYSTLSGVVEDVLQIILNLKEIVIRSHFEGTKTISLKAKGKGEVKAGDITHDADIEIINPDKVVCTMESGKLEMEMLVERGKGYRTSEQNKKSDLPVGFIPIDSIFTPVMKCNIATEEVRVGQEINYDRLILDVWTNGSMLADDAVRESAQILAKHVELFIHLGQKSDVLGISVPGKEETPESVLDMRIEDLELSARSLNCLKQAGVNSVAELVKYSEEDVMSMKNFGLKSLNEVKEKLSEYKLSLKPGPAVEEGGEA
jgi:DNA-directed RNA polymerase subunit alpha